MTAPTNDHPGHFRHPWVIALAMSGDRAVDLEYDALSRDGRRPTNDGENMMRFATELEALIYIDAHRREILRFSRNPQPLFSISIGSWSE